MIPKLAMTIGMRSSASTWLFNIVREIVASAVGYENVLSGYAEDCATIFAGPVPDKTRIVIKSHRIEADLSALIRQWDAPVFLSLRDPRDAIVSWMQRFKVPFGAALNEIARDAELVSGFAAEGKPFFRYEDRFFENRAVPPELGQKLGISVGPKQCDGLLSRYDSAKIKEFTRSVPTLPPERLIRDTFSIKDGVTQFHVNHIGDGQVGKWRAVFGPDETAKAVARLKPFLERFGYAAE